MKKELILLKEKLEALLGMINNAENGIGMMEKLDRDIFMDELRSMYGLVLSMDKPDPVEETEKEHHAMDELTQKLESLIVDLKQDFALQLELQKEELTTQMKSQQDSMWLQIDAKMESIQQRMVPVATAAILAPTLEASVEAPEIAEPTEEGTPEQIETTDFPVIEEPLLPVAEPTIAVDPEQELETEIESKPETEPAQHLETEEIDIAEVEAGQAPIFAPAELEPEPMMVPEQPSMEQVEALNNDILFDTEPTTIQPEEPTDEAPKSPTLWDMLSNKQTGSTLADQFKSGNSLVDQFVNNTSTDAPAATPEAPAAPATEEKAPEYENPATHEPIADEQPKAQPGKSTSVFDFLYRGSLSGTAAKPQSEERNSEPIAQPTHQPTPQPEVETSRPNPEPAAPTQPAEQNHATMRTLGEMLGSNRSNMESHLEHQMHANKVKDLQTVINISDKFKFMNDLFHNNMKAYNDFIIKLNSLSDREQAMQVMEETARAFKWDLDSLSYKEFMNIFDRKF